MNLDHNTLGWITFGLMTLSMLSGAFIFLNRKNSRIWTLIHVIISILAYVAMFLTLWAVRW